MILTTVLLFQNIILLVLYELFPEIEESYQQSLDGKDPPVNIS